MLVRTFGICDGCDGALPGARLPARVRAGVAADTHGERCCSFLVLLPFWTSLLVRTVGLGRAAAARRRPEPALLQTRNDRRAARCSSIAVRGLCGDDARAAAVHGAAAVCVMRSIPPASCARCAVAGRHADHGVLARLRAADAARRSAPACLMVFIQALGYYITPALVGGADDQMISYFIAFYASEDDQLGHGRGAFDDAACRHGGAVRGLRPSDRHRSHPHDMTSTRPAYETTGQRISRYALWCFAGMVLFFLVAPIGVIVPLSFSSGSFLHFPLPGLSAALVRGLFLVRRSGCPRSRTA